MSDPRMAEQAAVQDGHLILLLADGSRVATRLEDLPALRSGKVEAEDSILYGFGLILLVLISGYFVWSTSQLQGMIAPAQAIGRGDSVAFIDNNIPRSFLAAQVHVVQQRYRQAGAAVFSQSIRSNSGLLVGTLLTLMGCLIVVRRVRETPIEASVDSPTQASLKVITSSPGAFMAVLGTIIIFATIVVRPSWDVKDNDIVFPEAGGHSVEAAAAPNLPRLGGLGSIPIGDAPEK